MRRGFTLIEMSVVVAVIALLAAVTVPGYRVLVLRARADEARTFVQVIAHAELRYRRDHGAFLACPGEGPVPTTPTAFPGARECWRSLGVTAEGPLSYRYGVTVEGDTYQVLAEGDLDGDGVASRFALDGRTLGLTVERELE